MYNHKNQTYMKARNIILSAIAVIGMATPAFAKGTKPVKNTDNHVSPDTEAVAGHDINVYGENYTDGDKFSGLTRKVGFDRMIPPHALEVCYQKTTHIIFPSEIVYVDLGGEDIVAGLADGAKNVLRVKSASKSFKSETNLSVITEDGCFFTFNVKFAKEPLLLNIEMTDFIHDGEAVNRPNNAQEIYLERLGSESPMLVKLIMKSIYKQDKREIKHIGSKRFGVQFLLKSIYANNGLLYFHTEIKNTSNIPFDIEYVSFKIVDKKVVKRTAMQEQVLEPLRAQNYVVAVPGKSSERTVFALEKFTIPDDKQLVVEVAEKEGGRHQTFVVENADIVRANVIDELSIQ